MTRDCASREIGDDSIEVMMIQFVQSLGLISPGQCETRTKGRVFPVLVHVGASPRGQAAGATSRGRGAEISIGDTNLQTIYD
jgi:hypothetical protein